MVRTMAPLLVVLGLCLPVHAEILVYKFSETDTYFQQDGGEWQVRKETNRGYVLFEVDYAGHALIRGEAISYGKGAGGKWFQQSPADLELVRVDYGGKVQWVLLAKEVESVAGDALRGQFIMVAGQARNRNIGTAEKGEAASTLQGYILEDADRDAGRSIQMSKLTLTLYPSWTYRANSDDGGQQSFEETVHMIANDLRERGYDEQGVAVGDDIHQFVEHDYIDLSKISRISKFRSGVGHDYSDDFESCRSMKHYFCPREDYDWGAIKIYSPVTGTVSKRVEEWAGTQIWIQSADWPYLTFVIFHVNLLAPLELGDEVSAGQQIGTHIGSQTMSDIAVRMHTSGGTRLVSYFDVMADSLFSSYQSRGMATRQDAIISQAARDADPLACAGEAFEDEGTIENWVYLSD